jgi:hypothetical protein
VILHSKMLMKKSQNMLVSIRKMVLAEHSFHCFMVAREMQRKEFNDLTSSDKCL